MDPPITKAIHIFIAALINRLFRLPRGGPREEIWRVLMEMYEVAPVVENLENSQLEPPNTGVCFRWCSPFQMGDFMWFFRVQPLIHHHPSIMIQGEPRQPWSSPTGERRSWAVSKKPSRRFPWWNTACFTEEGEGFYGNLGMFTLMTFNSKVGMPWGGFFVDFCEFLWMSP